MARDPATDTEALVAASAVVFGRLGYRNATIDDIAKAAGISRPTVYKYTKSKRHLLDLMVTHVTGYLGERATQVLQRGGSAPERLRSLLRVHVESACANSEFYRIVLREQVELSPATLKRFRSWERQITADLADLIEECVADPQSAARHLDSKVLANLVLSMTISVYNWYDARGPVDREALLEHVLSLVAGVVPAVRVAQEARLG